MNVFTAEGLSKSYSEKPLFTDIAISLSEGQKMAIIAANGSGKTTLMRILSGKEQPDRGTVSKRSDLRIGYLEQEPYFAPGSKALDCIFPPEHPLLHAIGEYERIIDQGEEGDQAELQRITDYIDSNNGWDYEARAVEVLGKLGIHDLDKSVEYFSGGQKKRLSLARLLIEDHDMLLLDEPTNHLDLDMIEWLENYLSRMNKPMILITHDRYFLDGVCDTICELHNNTIFIYKGNYAYYLEKKDERDTSERATVDKARNIYSRELEWMRRQPKARGTKQKARQDSFYEIEEVAKTKLDSAKMQITMQMSRLGSKILELDYISKSFGNQLLMKDFTYTFKRGEKIGIIGKNGSGKSTLLNMIMGLIKPDEGKIRAGETVVFGYYSQEGISLPEDKRVLEVVKDIAEYVETGDGNWITVSQFLNHFQFTGSKQHSYVSKLSGGEKKRLYLLTILLKNPNFLILDEPTNDLDIVTLNTLEEFLLNYQGCLLMVTHDRYFMDRLVDHVFVLEGGGKVRDIHGNYSDYRSDSEKEVARKKTEAAAAPVIETKTPSVKKKFSYKEQKENDDLEKLMASLEKHKVILLERMAGGSTDHAEIKKMADEYKDLEKKLDDAMMRWMELQEKIS